MDDDLSLGIEAVASALLAGPWRFRLMCVRVARTMQLILVTDEIERLVRRVLNHFPEPPAEAELRRLLIELRGPVQLARGPVLQRDDLAGLAAAVPDLAALRRLLDVDDGELAWFADRQGRLRRATPEQLQHYRWRVLPKPGGYRLVAAPKPRLKEIQRRLLRNLVGGLPLHDAAHGSVRTRSVRTALTPHVATDTVVRVDLGSFFATIDAGRVRGLLRILGVADDVAAVVAGLCTTAVPHVVVRSIDTDYGQRMLLRVPHLPQGAPTSPALANAIAYGLDRRLGAVARRWDANYTRYVDDLVFSGTRRLRTPAFLAGVRAVIRDEGFAVAERKTVVLGSAGRQAVLGGVVNAKTTIARAERDRLRAIVHNCVRYGGPSQARGRPLFAAELLGRISAVAALDPALGARLRTDYDRIDWEITPA